MLERLLIDRPEKGIVDRERRRRAGAVADIAPFLGDMGEIDETVGRIGRGLDENEADGAELLRLREGGIDGVPGLVGGKADRLDPPFGQQIEDQRLGAAIDRLRVDQHLAGLHMGHDATVDRCHARREDDRGLGILPQRQAILEHLHVGIVEARIDEPGGLALGRLAAPGDEIEEVLAVLGALEDEGGGEKDRRLQGAFGQRRIVAVAHHLGFGPEDVIADGAAAIVFFLAHGGPSSVATGARRPLLPPS